ncbi:hypothetical protein YPPY66_3157, partial [Yersinia pestis PY-66]
MAPLILACDLI